MFLLVVMLAMRARDLKLEMKDLVYTFLENLLDLL